MPRIKQYAHKYAEDDLRKALRHNMIDAGFDNYSEVAVASGISQTTFYRKIQHLDTLTVRDMRKLFTVIRTPVPILLRLLAYPTKEINQVESILND